MASKIHTDNPKHHKYVTINKQERKKNIIDNINYNNINIVNFKSFLQVLKVTITNYLKPNYHSTYGHNEGIHSAYHGPNAPKGTYIIYDDCNHKTFRVYNKKKHKFISSIYKKQRYSELYIAPKHFKR